MQIKVADLRDSLKLLQSVIPRKPAVKTCADVLLQNDQITGTDLETMVMVNLKGAGRDKACLLPHYKTLELLKYVQGNMWVNIEQEGKTVKLAWDDGNAEFQVDYPLDFPDVRNIKPETEGTITDGDSMMTSLREMLTYRKRDDETRPILSGVTVSFGETMEICAGDGFRMAYQILPLAYPAPHRVTIPAGSVYLLCTLWDKAPPSMLPADSLVKQVISKRQLAVSISQERFTAQFGKITVLSNLIPGTAPNFAQLIPRDPPVKVSVWAPELERCIRRVRGVAKDGNSAVRIAWGEDKMTVSAKGEENSASAEMGIMANSTGGKTAVAFKYLLEYLTKKEGVVTIGITDEKSPLLLRYSQAPLVVVMPMFVEW